MINGGQLNNIGGIISINGNTTPSQMIVAGVGITVDSPEPGTTRIINTATGGINEITSSDNSLYITNSTGPLTDIIINSISIRNTLLTGLSGTDGRVVETDTFLEAFNKLSYAPTFVAASITSNDDTIVLGTPPNQLSLYIGGVTGIGNRATFPGGGGVISTTIIGNDSPITGAAVSNIGTDGVQNYITITDQLLTGLPIINAALVDTDSILIGLGKAQGQINALSINSITSVFGRSGPSITAQVGDYNVGQITGAAPLNSPIFSGTPKAPTQLQGDNSTNLATTAYVDTGLNLKANIASPSFTGIPTAPTAIPGTSTTQLATTAFVSIATSAGVTSFNTRTGAVVPALNDYSFSQISGVATIAQGGSGQSTANAALNAFLPTQASQSGKVLGTNGTDSSWVDVPIANVFTNNIGTNTMTSTVNGVSSSATLLSGVSASFNAPNSMRVQVNAFISDGLIIGSNALALAGTALTSAVNGVNATAVQVCPSGQSISSAITFTTLTEVLLLVAPSVNAAGTYILRLVSGANELVIEFTIGSNAFTSYNQSRIQILQVTDSAGVINATNIGNYLLFRGYLRNIAPDNYFAVTVSTPYTLLYANPLTMTVYQYGASYLNENPTITNMITTDISNLVSLAPANLIFRMKTAYVPVTNYNPQGYLYVPGSSSAAIFQYSINNLTGAITALTPASFATTAPYKIAITQLRNFIYGVVATGTSVFQFAINPTSGILSALAPATVTGPNTCTGIIVDPTDRFVYACGFGTGIFGQWSITKTTGQLVAIPSPPTAAPQMQDLVCHPSGKWLYAINNSNGLVYQYSITPATGALVPLGTPTIAAGTGPIMIVVHPSGLFAYVLNNGSATISQYSINTTTGQLTALVPATFATGANPQGICISANGRFIYYTSQTANTISQSTINLITGLIGAPTTSQIIVGARVCCFDFSGSFIYVVGNTLNQVSTFSINQTTGAMTAVGAGVATGINVNNIITA